MKSASSSASFFILIVLALSSTVTLCATANTLWNGQSEVVNVRGAITRILGLWDRPRLQWQLWRFRSLRRRVNRSPLPKHPCLHTQLGQYFFFLSAWPCC
ncbi:hypothetical protein BDZ97DRAFT_1817616, partial [Flammula alnicola]